MSFLILFIGAPGCGKGTQASYLSKILNLPKICMGDLVRDRLKANSSSMNEGKLINDDVINTVFLGELIKIEDKESVILDGYPRTIDQAFFLEKIKKNRKIIVFYFKVDYDVLFKSISGRFNCMDCGFIYNDYFKPTAVKGVCDSCGSSSMNFRSDDQEKVLVNRLLEYDNLTKPILEYYNKFGVVEEINSNQDIAEVSSYTLKLYNGLISL